MSREPLHPTGPFNAKPRPSAPVNDRRDTPPPPAGPSPLAGRSPPTGTAPPGVPSDPPAPLGAGLDARFPWVVVGNLALAFAVLIAALGLARFRTYHNDTFDLAFYARIVWGLGHGDFYSPLVRAHVLGLHASWVLLPLGLLGRVVPIVPLMLTVQAACVAGAAIPLCRIAHRRIGHPVAPYLTLAVWVLHPVIGFAGSYEFHPSSLALLPLCLALDYLDRRALRPALVCLVVAAACREDVALVCALVGLTLALRPRTRAVGLAAFAGFGTYFALYLFVVAPQYLPRTGSLQLHYGHLGQSPGAIVRNILHHPIATLKALYSPARALYFPRLLLPVAFFALLRPRWLLPALAPLAINLLSQFPTAVQVHSHYATLIVPFVILAAIHGVAQVMVLGALQAERYGLLAGCAVLLGSLHLQLRAGPLPFLGGRFEHRAYVSDHRREALDAITSLVQPHESVAAPDYLLPHLVERNTLVRHTQPMTRSVDVLVLSTEHRALHTGTQEIWRNSEETAVRGALYQRRYGVYRAIGDYLLLRRGWPVRTFARERFVEFDPDPRVHAAHADVGPSLAIAGWGMTPLRRGARVVLLLVPRRPWPHDLGFELGWGPMRPHLDRQDPARTYAFLPFEGVFLPSYTRVGEVVRTTVDLPATPDELRAHGLYFGARRVDGSRLDENSPHWTPLR